MSIECVIKICIIIIIYLKFFFVKKSGLICTRTRFLSSACFIGGSKHCDRNREKLELSSENAQFLSVEKFNLGFN